MKIYASKIQSTVSGNAMVCRDLRHENGSMLRGLAGMGFLSVLPVHRVLFVC